MKHAASHAPGHGLDLVLRWSGMGSVSECRSSPLKVPKIAMLLEIEQKLVNPQSLDKCSDSNHIETLKITVHDVSEGGSSRTCVFRTNYHDFPDLNSRPFYTQDRFSSLPGRFKHESWSRLGQTYHGKLPKCRCT